MTTPLTPEQSLEVKIAHLAMVQGVIGRMANDTQILKTLAITTAAAIIALAGTELRTNPIFGLISILPTFVFWTLNAYTLHIERAYRHLYDKIRKDEPVEPFSMDWRPHQKDVDPTWKLAFRPSVLLPYLSVFVILFLIVVFGGGAEAQNASNGVTTDVIQQAQ